MIISSTSNELDSILCSGLRSEWVTGDMSFVHKCQPLLGSFFPIKEPAVHIYSSDHPSSGKTTSILHNHVIQPSLGNVDSIGQQPYVRFPLSGDVKEAINLLRSMENERNEYNCQGIVI